MTINEIDAMLPNGFHDAYILKIELDYFHRVAKLLMEISFAMDGTPSPLFKQMIVEIHDFIFFVIEPIAHYVDVYDRKKKLLLDYSPVEEQFKRKIMSSGLKIPENYFWGSFFVLQWNSSIYFCAEKAFIREASEVLPFV